MQQPHPSPPGPTAARSVDEIDAAFIRRALGLSADVVILPVVVLPTAVQATAYPLAFASPPVANPTPTRPREAATDAWGLPAQLALAAIAAIALLMAIAIAVTG